MVPALLHIRLLLQLSSLQQQLFLAFLFLLILHVLLLQWLS